MFLCAQMWQHCDCMGVSKEVEHYMCEQCDPRPCSKVSIHMPHFAYYYFVTFSLQKCALILLCLSRVDVRVLLGH